LRGAGQAVDEDGCAAGVDGVGGYAFEDFDEGDLQAYAVGWVWDFESIGSGVGVAVAQAVRVDGFAGLMVEVAKLLSTKAWACAAVAGGVDVAALVTQLLTAGC